MRTVPADYLHVENAGILPASPVETEHEQKTSVGPNRALNTPPFSGGHLPTVLLRQHKHQAVSARCMWLQRAPGLTRVHVSTVEPSRALNTRTFSRSRLHTKAVPVLLRRSRHRTARCQTRGSYCVQISSEQREHHEQENRPLIRGPRTRRKSENDPKAIQTEV